MNYRLICFDAGFTLLKPRQRSGMVLRDALEQRGMTATEEALRAAWEVADRWFWDEYHRDDNDTWSSDERIHATWRHYHGLMLRELSVSDPDHAIADAVIAAYSLPDNWDVYPDVLETLDALQGQGATFGIVSDWGSSLTQIVEALDLARYFDFVLVSATARAAKPSPVFYQQALELGGAAPHQAVMIGDSYRADVLGARSVGMDAVLIDRSGTFEGDDVRAIRALTELPALLLR